MLTCDKCSGQIPAEAKFCPHCGDPVTEADRAGGVILSDRPAEVEISFSRSSSAQYPRAVEICQKLPTYREQGSGPSLSHRVSLPVTETELIINLWELVGNWKASRLLVDGQPASKSTLVYGGIGCYRSRQKAFQPEQYCFGENVQEFNFWGCKRLGMPVTPWGAPWLDHGQMDKSGVWHFDKPRIRHDLEAALHENRLCPVLERRRALETLEKLPDTVNPKVDSRWAYVTHVQEIRGEYREVAVGIKPVLKEAGRLCARQFPSRLESRRDRRWSDQGRRDSCRSESRVAAGRYIEQPNYAGRLKKEQFLRSSSGCDFDGRSCACNGRRFCCDQVFLRLAVRHLTIHCKRDRPDGRRPELKC